MTWPPVDTAVLVHLHAPDLAAAIEAVAELVGRFTVPDSSLVVIPVQAGVPLLRYTFRLFTSGSIYPLPQEAQPWLHLIPPAKPMPCSDAVADAAEALRELSSLAWLGTQRGTGPVLEKAADEARGRFRDAITRLDALPRDETITGLIDEIGRLAGHVHNETDDQATQGKFAETMARGLTGDVNDTSLNVSELIYIATQWDLDPADAEVLISSLARVKPGAEQ